MNRQEKLIAEIHAEFDTAQDRLLKDAHEVLKSANLNVVSVSDRLKSIGFKNTPTAKRGTVIKSDVVKSKDEAKVIEYFSSTYPFLKFLTEPELERICKKYNLIFAPVDRYIEDVPEKNISDIEQAQGLKIDDYAENVTFVKITSFYSDGTELKKWLNNRLIPIDPSCVSHYSNDVSEYRVRDSIKAMGYKGIFGSYIYRSAEVIKVNKTGIFIAAPSSHFDLNGLDKQTQHGFLNVFKTEIKDPIVFRYVRGGIQVLTKWGLEANDPDLVVPKLN